MIALAAPPATLSDVTVTRGGTVLVGGQRIGSVTRVATQPTVLGLVPQHRRTEFRALQNPSAGTQLAAPQSALRSPGHPRATSLEVAEARCGA